MYLSTTSVWTVCLTLWSRSKSPIYPPQERVWTVSLAVRLNSRYLDLSITGTSWGVPLARGGTTVVVVVVFYPPLNPAVEKYFQNRQWGGGEGVGEAVWRKLSGLYPLHSGETADTFVCIPTTVCPVEITTEPSEGVCVKLYLPGLLLCFLLLWSLCLELTATAR